jgi:cytochrome b involved in lipid metabolism
MPIIIKKKKKVVHDDDIVVDDNDDAVSLAETDSVRSYPGTEDYSDEGENDNNNGVVFRRQQHHQQEKQLPCDACPYCSDCCDSDNNIIDGSSCLSCQAKRSRQTPLSPQQLQQPPKSTSSCLPRTVDISSSHNRYYTMCEIRRHNHEGSCWIVVGDKVYDCTAMLSFHPAGVECILRRAGGAKDCTEDYEFHSKHGQQLFRKYYIGTVRTCPGSTTAAAKKNCGWWVLQGLFGK